MSTFLAGARKAVMAGFAAFATAVTASAADGLITNSEWGAAALGFLAAAVSVYFIPNTPPEQGRHEA